MVRFTVAMQIQEGGRSGLWMPKRQRKSLYFWRREGDYMQPLQSAHRIKDLLTLMPS